MKRQLLTLTALASLILSPIPGWAAPPAEQYLKPVAILEKLVDAASPPELRVDPRGQWLLQCQRAAYLSIDDLAQPELKLAGVRFSPDSRVSRREKFFTSLSIGPLRGASKAVSGLAPQLPLGARLLLAMGIEIAWEFAENSPAVIQHYRKQALAAGYVGDSVLNSVCDTFIMSAGFFFASVVRARYVIALALGLEIFTAYAIRDNLTLNVFNLIAPSDWTPVRAIHDWQAAAKKVPGR